MELDKIRTIIAKVLDADIEDITPDTAFIDLDADSLDLFQILTELEEAFGLEIPVEEADNIRTVGDAIAQIQRG